MRYDLLDVLPQQPENRLAGENRLLSLARLMQAHGLGGGGMYGGAYPRNRLAMAGMAPTARPQYHNNLDFPRVTPTPAFRPFDSFQDDIFVKPSAPGTETLDFDRMDLREQGAYPDYEEWLRARHLERAPRIR
jgi:hypothetical protein